MADYSQNLTPFESPIQSDYAVDNQEQAERLSIVSSDSIIVRGKQYDNQMESNGTVMSRLQWIGYIQVLFDQLHHTGKDNVAYAQLSNYITALEKIKPLLPLQNSHKSGKWLSFTEVHKSISSIESKQVTLDHVLDALLHSSICCSCRNETELGLESVLLPDTEQMFKAEMKAVYSDKSSDDDRCEIVKSFVLPEESQPKG